MLPLRSTVLVQNMWMHITVTWVFDEHFCGKTVPAGLFPGFDATWKHAFPYCNRHLYNAWMCFMTKCPAQYHSPLYVYNMFLDDNISSVFSMSSCPLRKQDFRYNNRAPISVECVDVLHNQMSWTGSLYGYGRFLGTDIVLCNNSMCCVCNYQGFLYNSMIPCILLMSCMIRCSLFANRLSVHIGSTYAGDVKWCPLVSKDVVLVQRMSF